MNLHTFATDIDAVRSRIESYRRALRRPGRTPFDSSEALQEISTMLEELRVAEDEIKEQNDALLATRHQVEIERQRFLDLFEFAPGAYLVTDPAGLIHQFNQAAAALFERDDLAHKPAPVLFTEPARPPLRQHLLEIAADRRTRQWESRALDPGRPAGRPVSVTVSAARDASLRWLITDISALLAAQEEVRRSQQGMWDRIAERTNWLTHENQALKRRIAELEAPPST